MDKQFLACSYSEDSHRHAILVDDGLTGILYLHAPSDDPEKTGEVEAACFAYNRIQPIEIRDVQTYRPNPPPIAEGYASKDVVCGSPESHEWVLMWSLTGEDVALTRDGNAWAIVTLHERRGFSRAVQVQGPMV
jgi:hypothetical protein